jgi:hypothetical protein
MAGEDLSDILRTEGTLSFVTIIAKEHELISRLTREGCLSCREKRKEPTFF